MQRVAPGSVLQRTIESHTPHMRLIVGARGMAAWVHSDCWPMIAILLTNDCYELRGVGTHPEIEVLQVLQLLHLIRDIGVVSCSSNVG
eukprot:SAG31_NODE_1098_length_9919_cov_2.877495_4_plen_88_part_00